MSTSPHIREDRIESIARSGGAAHTRWAQHESERKRQKRQSEEPMWLDNLPFDICVRIAFSASDRSARLAIPPASAPEFPFFPREKRDEEVFNLRRYSKRLLNLAEASKTQRRAVVRSVSGVLEICPEASIETVYRWKRVFSSSVRHLDLNHFRAERVALHPLLNKLPSVHCAYLDAKDILFRSIALCHSIKDLSLTVHELKDRSILFNALRSLQLEKLALCCAIEHHSECLVEEESDDEDHVEDNQEEKCIFDDEEDVIFSPITLALGASQDLKVLKVSCESRSAWFKNGALHFLTSCEQLEEFTIDGDVDAADLQELLPYARINLNHVVDVEDALSLSDSLYSFESRVALKEALLQDFPSCFNLVSLKIRVYYGNEAMLPTVLSSLPLLEELELAWSGGVFIWDGVYYRPKAGDILKSLRATSRIKKLGLIDVKVFRAELFSVLSLIGNQLEGLRIALTQQDDAPLERLEGVLIALSNFNRQIRSLEIPEWPRRQNKRAPSASQIDKALSALGFLATHAPLFQKKCHSNLRTLIREYSVRI